MANNNLSLLSNSTVTALTVNESKVIEDLKKDFGENFADNAKMCLMCDKSNNATHIIKCKAIFNAIYTYNTNCSELKKQQKARTAFSNATGINATDITRYMGIYALRSLWMNKATVCNGAKNDLEKEKRIDCYMSKYDYSKLVEIAKLREDEKLYLLDECEDTLFTYSKSQLLFMLEPYKMEIAPLNGRDNEFKARKQWIDDNKKIKDYGKEDSDNSTDNSTDNNSTFTIEKIVEWCKTSLTDIGKVEIIKQIFDEIGDIDSMKEICDYTSDMYSLNEELEGDIEE